MPFTTQVYGIVHVLPVQGSSHSQSEGQILTFQMSPNVYAANHDDYSPNGSVPAVVMYELQGDSPDSELLFSVHLHTSHTYVLFTPFLFYACIAIIPYPPCTPCVTSIYEHKSL